MSSLDSGFHGVIAAHIQQYQIRKWTEIVVCCFAVVATIISLIHTLHFMVKCDFPAVSRAAARIFFMIPIYCVFSVWSLWVGDSSRDWTEVLGTIREAYEPVVIFSFLQLFFTLLGSWSILPSLLPHPPHLPEHPWFMKVFFSKWDTPTRYFLSCLRGPVWFIYISVINVPFRILSWTMGNVYNYKGVMHGMYLISTIVRNVVQGWALYGLLMLYVALSTSAGVKFRNDTERMLKEHFIQERKKWFMRFFCIKGIVFFTYWQMVVLEVLVHFKVIHTEAWGIDKWTDSQISVAIQNVLICVEMLFFAVLHVASYNPYDFSSAASIKEDNYRYMMEEQSLEKNFSSDRDVIESLHIMLSNELSQRKLQASLEPSQPSPLSSLSSLSSPILSLSNEQKWEKVNQLSPDEINTISDQELLIFHDIVKKELEKNVENNLRTLQKLNKCLRDGIDFSDIQDMIQIYHGEEKKLQSFLLTEQSRDWRDASLDSDRGRNMLLERREENNLPFFLSAHTRQRPTILLFKQGNSNKALINTHNFSKKQVLSGAHIKLFPHNL